MDYQPADSATRTRRSWVAPMILVAIAFLAGLAAMGWLLAHWGPGARWLGIVPAAAPVEQAAPPALAVEAEPQAAIAPATPGAERPMADPEATRRINRLEERLAQIDLQSRVAVGNADRAESLLVAFAARRALDRGVALGYIETLLRQRFAATQPQAVATVLTAARQPVTLQKLQADLRDLSPQLTGGGPQQSFWQAFRSELGGLITIRKEGTPSTMPAERLRRAEQSLQTGAPEVALVEVMRLPGRENAKAWIDMARRYVSARQALDAIETAALMDPQAEARPAGVAGVAAQPASAVKTN
jgi:hypothetical protein